MASSFTKAGNPKRGTADDRVWKYGGKKILQAVPSSTMSLRNDSGYAAFSRQPYLALVLLFQSDGSSGPRETRSSPSKTAPAIRPVPGNSSGLGVTSPRRGIDARQLRTSVEKHRLYDNVRIF